MLYRRHQADIRIATIWHWKYKRKGPLAESMQSGKLRQDNFPMLRRLKYPEAEATKVSRSQDKYSVPRPRRQEHTEVEMTRLSQNRDGPSIPTNIIRRLPNNKDCRIDVAMGYSELSIAIKEKTKKEGRDY
jgi:hypothetical protein